MHCAIAPQFVGHEQHRLCPLALQALTEEAVCGAAITTRLDEDVDHVAVLVNGTPQILLSTSDRHEDFVQIPGVAEMPLSAS